MRTMGKVLIVFICLVLLCGCQSSNGSEGEPEEPQNELVYLSGYPDDVVPLYKPVMIDSCSFAVRDDLNYVIGKDLYAISFESEATMDELSSYYRSLMDDLDEEMSYNDYIFEGVVQGRRVNVSISDPDQARDNALGTPIHLSVGMLEEEYVTVNPYFEDYPQDIIEIYGFDKLQEYSYRESYFYGEARYATIYQTKEEAEKILEFYRDKYKNQAGFQETDSGSTKVFSWENDVYRCSVRYDNQPNIQFLQLLVDKDLQD